MTATKEIRSCIAAIVFVLVYCGLLFLFSHILGTLEKGGSLVLKPEPGQIAVLGLFILIYYFTFFGLFSFSLLNKTARIISITISLLISVSVFYGIYLWYSTLMNNPFLFHDPSLPWYAKEQNKFLIANTPLILFLLWVFIERMLMMIEHKAR